MHKTLYRLIPCLFAGVLACSAVTTIVHQPEQRVARRDGSAVPASEIKQAVLRALERRKWKVDKTTADAITAQVTAGGHMATARVTVGSGTYRIEHVDSSEGLRYDGKEIHHRYNHWIRRLDSTIMGELQTVVRVQAPLADAPSVDDLK